MRAQGFVSRRGADQLMARAAADLRRQVWRMGRDLAPRLEMKSSTEIRWIYQAAVNTFCDEMDRMVREKIMAMPGVGARPERARRGADRV